MRGAHSIRDAFLFLSLVSCPNERLRVVMVVSLFYFIYIWYFISLPLCPVRVFSYPIFSNTFQMCVCAPVYVVYHLYNSLFHLQSKSTKKCCRPCPQLDLNEKAVVSFASKLYFTCSASMIVFFLPPFPLGNSTHTHRPICQLGWKWWWWGWLFLASNTWNVLFSPSQLHYTLHPKLATTIIHWESSVESILLANTTHATCHWRFVWVAFFYESIFSSSH